MAIIKEVLAEFQTSGKTHYRIEYNENGYIHIHIDSVRIDMTPNEFLEMSGEVIEGEKQLREKKDGI